MRKFERLNESQWAVNAVSIYITSKVCCIAVFAVAAFASVQLAHADDTESETLIEPMVTEPKGQKSVGGTQPSEIPSSDSKSEDIRVSKQKKCQILIETDDIRFLTLRSGTLVTLKKDAQTTPARINKTISGKIFASLRKSDCGKNVIGATVTNEKLPEESNAVATVETPRDGSSEANQPAAAVVVKPSNNGIQTLAGIYSMSTKSSSSSTGSSLTNYTLRISYEWFDSPAGISRRPREGIVAGLGLTFTGWGKDYNDEWSSSFAGYLQARTGFRWASGVWGVTAAPTFKYFFLSRATGETVFFPSENPPHEIGLDVQVDYAVSNQMRIVLVPNFNFLIMNQSPQITSKLTIFELLTGVWFLF